MTVNWRRGTELAPRRLWDRTRSVLGGIPTQSVRNDQSDLRHADHAHACAQRYTRVLLRPRTVGGGLPAMLFLKRSISD